MSLSFMYITSIPEIAAICDEAGVERVFVDLEWKGKVERQGHIDSVKSFHTLEDVARIRKVLHNAELLVRVNPVDENTPAEVSGAIEAGADILMLPMARTCEEVRTFVEAVAGRARTMLLLETRGAEENLEEILKAGGINEVHIGLNDLSLDYGLPFMFTLLANGTVERICERIRKFNVPYGFGGIARLGMGKVSAENILIEHVRLGSSRVILSRSFYDASQMQSLEEAREVFATEFFRIREAEAEYRKAPQGALLENFRQLQELCACI